MSNLEYRDKYLKYKAKYINLKNTMDEQDGGLRAKITAYGKNLSKSAVNTATSAVKSGASKATSAVKSGISKAATAAQNKATEVASALDDSVHKVLDNRLWEGDYIIFFNKFMAEKATHTYLTEISSPGNTCMFNFNNFIKNIPQDFWYYKLEPSNTLINKNDGLLNVKVTILPNLIDDAENKNKVEFAKNNIEQVKNADAKTHDDICKKLEEKHGRICGNNDNVNTWYGFYIKVDRKNKTDAEPDKITAPVIKTSCLRGLIKEAVKALVAQLEVIA